MGKMDLSFADVEDAYEVLPEGIYDAVVSRIEVRESKSSDYNYLNFELDITDEDYEGRKLWMIASFSPKALFRLRDTFAAFGIEEEEMELEWDDDVEITPQAGPLLLNPDLEGEACKVVVYNEPFEGKEQNRVKELRSADSSEAPAKASAAKKGAAKKPARRAVR